MRILYSLPHPADTLADQRAGHVIRPANLLEALERSGHTVHRCEAARQGASQSTVSTYRNVVRRALPPYLAESVRDAGRMLHAKRFAGDAVAAVRTFRPDVVFETETVFGRAGTEVSRRLGVPFVLDDVGPEWENAEQYGVRLDRLARRARRDALREALLVVAVSPTIEACLVGEGVAASKIALVPNGVHRRFVERSDVDVEAVRSRLGIPPGRVVFLFVGSFQHFHRVDLLIDAFAGLHGRSAQLLLVGDGDDMEASRRRVRTLGLDDSVTFAGRVPHEEVADVVLASDVAVLPATAEYMNPMKVFEYLAGGNPVIAPRQLALTGAVENERDGLLFEPGNARSMADAMRRLMDDGPLRAELGTNAARKGLESTWEHRAADLTAAIDASLARA